MILTILVAGLVILGVCKVVQLIRIAEVLEQMVDDRDGMDD